MGKRRAYIGPNGDAHVLIVLRVDEHDSEGRPSKCTIGYEDAVFKLDDGAEFLTAWVKESLTKGRDKKGKPNA